MPELLDMDLVWAVAIFVGVGFLAQLVDGALGMAYGTLSSTVLMSVGVPPAAASAAIHAAECVTTGASGISHLVHKNVDFGMLVRLAPAGILGGVLGAYVLTGLDSTLLKALISLYLLVLGAMIISRALFGRAVPKPFDKRGIAPLGFAGGFLDASGGGGWGPLVTSTLIGGGHPPRHVIGTVNTAEFFVTVAISATFIWALFTGRLEFGQGAQTLAAMTGGLIVGGVAAAPFAGLVTKVVSPRKLMGAVGIVIILLSGWKVVDLWPKLVASHLLADAVSLLSTGHVQAAIGAQ